MKSFKKIGILWCMIMIMVFGIKAQATELDDIIAKTNTAMQNVKLMDGKAEMKNPETNQYELFMEIAFDVDAKLSYMDIMGYKVWMDGKNGVSYNYNPKTREYLFCPDKGDNVQSEITFNTSDYSLDKSLAYTYLGEEEGCYKLNGVSEDGNTVVNYWIDKNTYLIIEAVGVAPALAAGEFVEQRITYTYPEDHLVIPEEVIKNAELIEYYMFTKSNISYYSKKVKGKIVLYVKQSKKAKNKVKIPDTVTVCGKKYKVYGIDTRAFYNNRKITSVTIGNNVRKIGDKAFYNNKKLSSVTIGKNVTHIGKETFRKSKKLKNVTIKSIKLKKIGSKAFNGNAKTLKVKVPGKKAVKYKKMLQRSKMSSKLVIKKF